MSVCCIVRVVSVSCIVRVVAGVALIRADCWCIQLWSLRVLYRKRLHRP